MMGRGMGDVHDAVHPGIAIQRTGFIGHGWGWMGCDGLRAIRGGVLAPILPRFTHPAGQRTVDVCRMGEVRDAYHLGTAVQRT
ncbi:hypothetical protein D3C77_705480 [compost metagenome]